MTDLLSRLNIRARMVVILITFLIPLGILAFKVNNKLVESIEFSVQEERGVEYVKPLFSLLNEVADYQISRLEKDMGTATADDVSKGEATVDALITKLREIDGRIGENLDLTIEGLKKHKQGDITLAAFEKKWNAIKASPTYSAEAFNDTLETLATMIKHVGDASNLILDGDLDTYYLVDANFNAFSGMLKDLALAKSIGYASLHANNGTLDSQAADALRPLADTLEKEFIAHAAQSITTAINQDSNYHGLNATLQTKVSEKLANFEKDAKDTAAMLRSITKGGSKDAGQFIETMDIPHDETAELAIESLNALHEMILVRIAVLKNERMLIMGEVLGLIVLAFVLFLIVSNSITRPIKAMTAVMRKLADGDTGVEIPSTQSKDEVGEMARTVLVFKDNMIHTEELRAEQEAQKLRAAEEKRAAMHAMANNFEMSVKSVVTEVSASASQMRGNAERLSQLAGETKSNSAIVSSSATEAAQTATQVAAAAEELAAAIGEISAQVQKSSGVATQASAQANSINQSMHLLVEKSNRVGEVIQFITNIASQINLLALNATIESARAGEAGRGFAVVASEVKNLANQTAKATEEIVQQVQSMQEATHEAVASVGQIISIIGEISSSTAGVAAAVEEQSAATNEISRNIAHTASGTNEISRSIVAVEQGADETGSSSRQVLDSAKALSEQSAALSQKVDEFLRTVRNM
jgi:methyl-accepting chemotaxis protein